jgi:2-oxoglutarate ferredoxin oxidoreductase subunit alpha
LSTREVTFGIVGSGGDGVITVGDILTSAFARDGLFAFNLKNYGPQIRGGESSCKVKTSCDKIFTIKDTVDLLVAFNWEDFKKFKSEYAFKAETIIYVDTKDATPDEALPIALEYRGGIKKVPFEDISRSVTGAPLSKNMVSLGVIAATIGMDLTPVREIVVKKMAKKPAVLEQNLKALEAGYAYVKDAVTGLKSLDFSYTPSKANIVMSGNDAVAYGALFSGCKFFAGYPITPSSEVMEWLSREMPKFGGTLVQVEDEIAALGYVIGASFGGAKSFTSTSGPGISLMSEMIGLAAISEIPCVILNVQRGGPATGVPTKMEQADLGQALWGTHGDATVVTIAPINVNDCFTATVNAFNMAEKYQVPVIILSDQYVGQRKEAIQPFDLTAYRVEDRLVAKEGDSSTFKRYEDTPSGISAMPVPLSSRIVYETAGIEHNEHGVPSAELRVHHQMTSKRFRKLAELSQEYPLIEYYGLEKPDMVILTWGSSFGACREAVETLNKEGFKLGALAPRLIYPAPRPAIEAHLQGISKLLVAELSFKGQFLSYCKTHFDLPVKPTLYNRVGGAHMSAEEVIAKIREVY